MAEDEDFKFERNRFGGGGDGSGTIAIKITAPAGMVRATFRDNDFEGVDQAIVIDLKERAAAIPDDLARAILEAIQQQGATVKEVETSFGIRLLKEGFDIAQVIALGVDAATFAQWLIEKLATGG